MMVTMIPQAPQWSACCCPTQVTQAEIQMMKPWLELARGSDKYDLIDDVTQMMVKADVYLRQISEK